VIGCASLSCAWVKKQSVLVQVYKGCSHSHVHQTVESLKAAQAAVARAKGVAKEEHAPAERAGLERASAPADERS